MKELILVKIITSENLLKAFAIADYEIKEDNAIKSEKENDILLEPLDLQFDLKVVASHIQ